MGKIKTLIRVISDSPQNVGRLADSKFSKWKISRRIPDSTFLKIRYHLCTHKRLHLKNPLTFNEKLQWLKLHYFDKQYTILADKYEVKQYIRNNYPELKTIPTIGVWNRPEEIEFEKLPDKFVLKCTHDTGSIIICKDKKTIDRDDTIRKLNQALNRNMYYPGREWVYKDIKARIIAEEYLEELDSSELLDYKLMCFNGVVKCSFVCSDRFSDAGLHVTFFDRDWNILPFTRHYPRRETGIARPANYEKMIVLAEQMSHNMPFVRIDFYEVNNEIYFGEYTFFPGSGLEEFTPEEWDRILGDWLVLPHPQRQAEI